MKNSLVAIFLVLALSSSGCLADPTDDCLLKHVVGAMEISPESILNLIGLSRKSGGRRVRWQIGAGVQIVALVTLVSLPVKVTMAAGNPSDLAPAKTEDPHSQVPASPLCLLTRKAIACPDFALACKEKTKLRAGSRFSDTGLY